MARVAALALCGVLLATGCARLSDDAGRRPAEQPVPTPAVEVRLDAPDVLLDWPQSLDRHLRGPAEKNMGQFRQFLDGDTISAVGTAWAPVKGGAALMVSGVSGRVRDPQATLARVFSGLPKVSDVRAVPPGPLGGVAACSRYSSNGLTAHACAWADSGSFALVSMLNLPAGKRPEERLVEVRGALEHAGGRQKR
ncbi:hypothetical protein [Micromonospora okii]|uniref:hypothetical protein n=1 Tax=Micromonospora okii TaxID=1182970 RepID=UPI001E432ED4|nr:hypothetical protein [Micromonospora okii]